MASGVTVGKVSKIDVLSKSQVVVVRSTKIPAVSYADAYAEVKTVGCLAVSMWSLSGN